MKGLKGFNAIWECEDWLKTLFSLVILSVFLGLGWFASSGMNPSTSVQTDTLSEPNFITRQNVSFWHFDVAVAGDDTIYTVGEGGYDDFVLVKWNQTGHVVWNRTWGGSDRDKGWGVAVSKTDGIYTVGVTESPSVRGEIGGVVALVKWNSEGDLLWNQTWEGLDRGHDEHFGTDVVVGTQAIYTVASTTCYDGQHNAHGGQALIKWDPSGHVVWNQTREGNTWDNKIVISKSTIYTVGYGSLVRWHVNGTIQWKHELKTGEGIAVDNEGYVYTVGQALVKWSPTGKVVWRYPQEETTEGSDNDVPLRGMISRVGIPGGVLAAGVFLGIFLVHHVEDPAFLRTFVHHTRLKTVIPAMTVYLRYLLTDRNHKASSIQSTLETIVDELSTRLEGPLREEKKA